MGEWRRVHIYVSLLDRTWLETECLSCFFGWYVTLDDCLFCMHEFSSIHMCTCVLFVIMKYTLNLDDRISMYISQCGSTFDPSVYTVMYLYPDYCVYWVMVYFYIQVECGWLFGDPGYMYSFFSCISTFDGNRFYVVLPVLPCLVIPGIWGQKWPKRPQVDWHLVENKTNKYNTCGTRWYHFF